MNVTKLGWHLTLTSSIADVKAYPSLQRSGGLNPVYVGIWSAFAKCRPESLGLVSRIMVFVISFDLRNYKFTKKIELYFWNKNK